MKKVNTRKVNKKKKSKESKTSPRRLRALKKQVAALELRVQGKSFRAIALELKYSGPSGAFAAVEAALKRTLTGHSEEVRNLELERLDRLQMEVWILATEGANLQAIEKVLAIMRRRAALLGLDAPIEYTFDDIRRIARKIHAVVNSEVASKAVRERIFDALGFAEK